MRRVRKRQHHTLACNVYSAVARVFTRHNTTFNRSHATPNIGGDKKRPICTLPKVMETSLTLFAFVFWFLIFAAYIRPRWGRRLATVGGVAIHIAPRRGENNCCSARMALVGTGKVSRRSRKWERKMPNAGPCRPIRQASPQSQPALRGRNMRRHYGRNNC
jgi:hypothetical protein